MSPSLEPSPAPSIHIPQSPRPSESGGMPLKRLRKIGVSNKVKLEGPRVEGSVECAICLNDLRGKEERKVGRLGCGHFFCYSCIFESSRFANKCPYCRAPFNSIRRGTKTVAIPDARLEEYWDDPMDEPCYVCGRNDDFERLLECEYCEYAYCHTYCDPRLHSNVPPDGHWYCMSCEQMLQENGQEEEEEEEEESSHSHRQEHIYDSDE